MADYCFVIKGLTKVLPGGRILFKDLWLSFYRGAKIGILGVNGTGKSTLLKIMAGLDKEYNGEAWAAKNTTVGYLPQEPELPSDVTVFEAVRQGQEKVMKLLQEYEELSMRLCEPLEEEEMNALLAEQGNLQEQIDVCDGWGIDQRVKKALQDLGCPPADSLTTHLSGGEKRRVALCRLLMQNPDILLLDEPTNHLDAQAIAHLEEYLASYRGTVVLVTHDRYFLDRVVGWILELDRGQGYPFEGNYSAWLTAKQKRLEQEASQDDAKQRTLQRELEWIRQTPQGRRAKSKARIQAYEDLLAQEQATRVEDAQIIIPSGPRLGNVVLEAKDLEKSYGSKVLFKGLNFTLPAGGIVGVIGSNGAGKTTLFRLITEQEKLDHGTLKMGETVKVGYVNQTRDALNPEHNVWQAISDGLDYLTLGPVNISSRAYCGAFGFKGSDQQKKVGLLSGGERGRVHLAKLLKGGANLLLLDEPSNDLDVETLRALEDALVKFAGCAIVISHDRYFLDRIATHILAFEGQGHVTWFEGSFSEYHAYRQAHPLKI